jgi:hypothetical protein
MTNDGLILLLTLVFFMSCVVGAAGHLVLYLILKGKGVGVTRFLSNVPFYPVIVYFRQGPAVRSRALDVLAVAVALSVPLVILTALLLFPEIYGGHA